MYETELSPDYEIRFIKSGEEAELLVLLKQVFDGWPHFDLPCSPQDHWRWKYMDNPQGKSWIIVADYEDELIGCLHINFNNLKVGSKVFLCTQSADTGVLTNHRDFGVFTKLRSKSELLDDKGEIGLHYGVSSNPIVHKAVTKIDPKRYRKPLSFMIKVNDIVGSYTKSYMAPMRVKLISGYYAAKMLNGVKDPLKASYRKPGSELLIAEVKQFDDRIDDFWAEIKDSHSLIPVINREYLNWRYCDPRGGNYIIRQAEEAGKIMGFSVLRINNYGTEPPTGYIVGLYNLPDKLDCAQTLLDDALNYFKEHRINLIKYCVNKGHPYEAMFKERGFIVMQGETLFSSTARNIGGEFEDYKNSPPEKVLFQYGSFDWI